MAKKEIIKLIDRDVVSELPIVLNNNFDVVKEIISGVEDDVEALKMKGLALNELSWENGEKEGPVLAKGDSKTKPIPSASLTTSGVINTDKQSFSGKKTFNNGIVTSLIQAVGDKDLFYQEGNKIYLGGKSSGIYFEYDTNGKLRSHNVSTSGYTDSYISYIGDKLNELNDAIDNFKEDIKKQLDGRIEYWTGVGAPTASTRPWLDDNMDSDTDEDRFHVNDRYTDIGSKIDDRDELGSESTYSPTAGMTWVYVSKADGYEWKQTSDKASDAILSALQNLAGINVDIKNLQDGKVNVFTTEPVNYTYCDVWFCNETKIYNVSGVDYEFKKGEIFICINENLDTYAHRRVSFVATDWRLATTSFTSIQTSISTLEESLHEQIDGMVSSWYGIGAPVKGDGKPKRFWSNEDENHNGDFYTDLGSIDEDDDNYSATAGSVWSFVKNGGDYEWQSVAASSIDVIKNKIKGYDADLAAVDGRVEVFYSWNQVKDGHYDYGDIWFYNGDAPADVTGFIKGHIYWCSNTEKDSDDTVKFNKSHWIEATTYTDEVAALKKELEKQIIDNRVITWYKQKDLNDAANKNYRPWTDSKDDEHVGDEVIYIQEDSNYNESLLGSVWKFTKNGETYVWISVKQSDIASILSRIDGYDELLNAIKDSQVVIYRGDHSVVAQAHHDIGDLWLCTEDYTVGDYNFFAGEIYYATIKHGTGNAFEPNHWTSATNYTQRLKNIEDKTVYSVDNEYARTDINNAPAENSSSWNTICPTEGGKFIWTRTKINFADGTHKYTNVNMIEVISGKGIKSVVEIYGRSESTVAEPTVWRESPNHDDIKSLGDYIWTYTHFVYTDDTTYDSPKKCVTGPQGKSGAHVTGVEEYFANGSDPVTRPVDTDFTNPAPEKGSYRWRKFRHTMSEGNPTGWYYECVGYIGSDGASKYTWIKYALTDDKTKNDMQDSPSGMYYIGIAYNKDTANESSNKSDYSWSRIKGDAGESVRAEYSSNGSSWHSSYQDGDIYMRTAAGAGEWSSAIRIKGEKGDSGEIKPYVDYKFGISHYEFEHSDITDWLDTPVPTSNEKPYLWTKITRYGLNASKTDWVMESEQYVRLTGPKGESGTISDEDRALLERIPNGFNVDKLLNTDMVTTKEEDLGDGVKKVTTTITNANGETVFTTVNIPGSDFVYTNIGIGNEGHSDGAFFKVSKEGLLEAQNAIIQGEINATSGHIGGCEIKENKLRVAKADFRGVKVTKKVGDEDITTFEIDNDGNVSVNGSVTVTGSGAKSIDTVNTYYKITDSPDAVTAPTKDNKDGWSTTNPRWEEGMYLWTCTETIFTTGDPKYSTPVCTYMGKDGKTPVKGVDYNDGAPGTPGHSPVISIDEETGHWLIDGNDTGHTAKPDDTVSDLFTTIAEVDGSTKIKGGRIKSNLIFMTNTGDETPVAGMSGLDDNVGFWAGGTYSQAVDGSINDGENGPNALITKDGKLYAKEAKISGDIETNNLKCTLRSNGDYIRKTTINENEISINGIMSGVNSSIKLALMDIPEDDDNADFKGKKMVPTLVMTYNGYEYYLRPDSFKQLKKTDGNTVILSSENIGYDYIILNKSDNHFKNIIDNDNISIQDINYFCEVTPHNSFKILYCIIIKDGDWYDGLNDTYKNYVNNITSKIYKENPIENGFIMKDEEIIIEDLQSECDDISIQENELVISQITNETTSIDNDDFGDTFNKLKGILKMENGDLIDTIDNLNSNIIKSATETTYTRTLYKSFCDPNTDEPDVHIMITKCNIVWECYNKKYKTVGYYYKNSYFFISNNEIS